jgi:hypothetical protein
MGVVAGSGAGLPVGAGNDAPSSRAMHSGVSQSTLGKNWRPAIMAALAADAGGVQCVADRRCGVVDIDIQHV